VKEKNTFNYKKYCKMISIKLLKLREKRFQVVKSIRT